jgi:TPR repeat protein
MSATTYNSDEVNAAFERKDYEFVLSEALPHANAGNPAAQCMISLLYQCGLAVPRDFAKAEEWLLKATAQDDPVAWNNLGSLYIIARASLPHGEGKSHECYLRAKELGFDCAAPYPP